MIFRLRESMRSIMRGLARLFIRPPPDRNSCGEVRGTSHRFILVKPDAPAIFREAIFILRDDYLQHPGISSAQLLRQAKLAAKAQAHAMQIAPQGIYRLTPLANFLVGSAATLITLKILEVIS